MRAGGARDTGQATAEEATRQCTPTSLRQVSVEGTLSISTNFPWSHETDGPIRLPLRLITRCGLCSSSVCKERHVKEAYRCVALVNERTLMDIGCWVTRHPRRCTTARRELRCRTIGVGRRLAAAVARSPTRTKNTPEDKNPPDRSNKALEERDRPLRRRLTS